MLDRTCDVCERSQYAKGYCFKHYQTMRRNGSATAYIRDMHGMRYTPEYKTWESMKARCNNKNNVGYKEYGGKGIKVFKDWEESFMSFYEYIGKKPSPAHTIDRIDNSKGYEPGNVRWATIHQQNANRSMSNKKVGVAYLKKQRKWVAYININKNREYLGYFDEWEDAVKARVKAEIRLGVQGEGKRD